VKLRRDPERLQKLRIAVRYLLRGDAMARGFQTRLAEHFDVSRQRVHQVVEEERLKKLRFAVRYLLREDALSGREPLLATRFRVSRERVDQLIQEERLLAQPAAS
jgi:plasmid maintenance system antidote protein VapI